MSWGSDLDSWRARADYWLTPIEDVKTALRASRERLDNDHPSWKAAYEALPGEYLKHDARREFFVTMRVILQNMQLSYVFMRDELSDEGWWIEQAGEVRPVMAAQALREFSLMVKFFTIHGVATATEEAVRAIVRSGPQTFTVRPTAEFRSVYRHVLKVTSLQKFLDLFEVLRLTRNTIHTNGVFLPAKGQNIQLAYKGRKFDFEVGKTLDWLGEDFLVWLPEQLNEAMMSIVTFPPVASIPQCPRGP